MQTLSASTHELDNNCSVSSKHVSLGLQILHLVILAILVLSSFATKGDIGRVDKQLSTLATKEDIKRIDEQLKVMNQNYITHLSAHHIVPPKP